jgi:hypothetical protein
MSIDLYVLKELTRRVMWPRTATLEFFAVGAIFCFEVAPTFGVFTR